jgi:hypothetical protein
VGHGSKKARLAHNVGQGWPRPQLSVRLYLFITLPRRGFQHNRRGYQASLKSHLPRRVKRRLWEYP